ncbi:uncharacterized protein PAN0_014d4937 [Moesziomyces antarcticus]|uniref:Uncharacterized protein n=2 Tax=Pseudozyma antarctica TaxID=84753 RepID=A0A5C3FVZ0_PSEA2|nr:uncharacterized protein PAN0_014d4937 [Moesziomyces antarcticus]GAK66714.1 conserved hypothetical protein [Moesziomyces antarcticus]SPO47761.1 uncharacterized protein PSANT_05449 [Moesziomyces antarcticus]
MRRPSAHTPTARCSAPRGLWLLALCLPFAHLTSAQSAADSIPARWGQASALVGSLFVVQGGKTQGTGGGFTYSSAPSDAQMYALDLSTSFSLASPPWQSISLQDPAAAAPAVSFHTISPLNSTSLLLFGGDGSPTVPVQTNNDSAFIVNIAGPASNHTVSYQPVPASWNQPMRRIYHTSEANGRGSVWIVGGQKADGSGLTLDERWSIDSSASSPVFELAPAAPPGSLVGSTSTLLSDGTLLLLGGLDASGQLQSMEDIYSYSSATNRWTQTATQAASNATDAASQRRAPAFPAPRRDHVAVSLPNQRIFIHGGASQDLSTAFSDAWILDWSVNPPVWTQLDATAGPGARYGHSAVAYGREVLISFGWAGGNAAPTGVHVFDASSLTASSSLKGSWSGGSWSSSTYTPDPQMSRPASSSGGQGSSSGSSSAGNGSSSSSGGNASTDAGSDSGDAGTTSTSGSFPSGNTAHGDGDSGSSGASDGAKAGAAVGALLGAGLVVGAGYAAYRRRSLNNYRRYGRGSTGVLGFGARRTGGPSDDDYLMEKGFIQSDYDRPYHRTDGGAPLTGGMAYGRKRARTEGSPWTAGNVGHAMEGSGPHFRERIAILAGRGKRDAHVVPRVDMLADEGDGNSLFRPLASAERLPNFGDDDDDEENAELWHGRRMREHSYVHVGDHDLSSGDIGQLQHDDEAEHEYSPFEDRPEESRALGFAAAAAGARGYGRLADREVEEYDESPRSDDGRSDIDTQEGGASSGPSLQSHSTASRSDVPSSSKSSDALSSGGLVSFSDTSHGRYSGNMMKRSPTWWDRFMGSSRPERSASGRFLSGPNAAMPIRDPAPPPVSGLQAIRESPRSREVSEQNPFADAVGLDEHGRRMGEVGHEQGRSVSSVGSARTGASSHFESRLRGMDVIQRVRTGSSRRTHSTRTRSSASDGESDHALSRAPTLLRPRNIASSDAVDTVDEEETPGEVVWKPELWSGAARLQDVDEEHDTPNGAEALSPVGARLRASNVSETPSITPLTTKRARLNPVMVSPLFPSRTPHASAPALPAANTASVKERVKAFESHSPADPAPSAWSASLSKAQAPSTSPQRTTSPSPTTTSRTSKSVYTTMVPRPTLFVANPDDSHP